MKSYKNLYARVCAFDNLYEAFRKARRGKRGWPGVAAFFEDEWRRGVMGRRRAGARER